MNADFPGDAEFNFELLTCRWAELAWPPGSTGGRRTSASGRDTMSDEAVDSTSAVLVARQLGTQKRRWDTVVVECDPAGLAARAAFGPDELGSDLLHVVRNAPADWEWYRDALPDPGYSWRYVREAIHEAEERDAVGTRRVGNRIEIRRVAPYPDWVRRIVAVENKPDLDAAAARALSSQLTHDVDTALADEVWVATAATGDTVEPALLGDFPVEVGVLALNFADGVDADAAEVEWLPSDLDSTSDAPTMEADEKAHRRRLIAERAYGRGWRSYLDSMRPDCRHFELVRAGDALVPWCAAKGKVQTDRECRGGCPDFSPEPPQWRTMGWPIEGGPGKGLRRLLERRRERVRGWETTSES
jgi:hypothetical protein